MRRYTLFQNLQMLTKKELFTGYVDVLYGLHSPGGLRSILRIPKERYGMSFLWMFAIVLPVLKFFHFVLYQGLRPVADNAHQQWDTLRHGQGVKLFLALMHQE